MRSRAVAETAGISFRQLDHWCAQGYLGARLRGTGTGNRREFSEVEASVALAVACLVRFGFTPQAAAAAIAQVDPQDGVA
jgi:DNA-binding transcriptional MerR regulator